MKEVVILVGMQGSGKSTFFKQRFVDTHSRINLDMLQTRGGKAPTAAHGSPVSSEWISRWW